MLDDHQPVETGETLRAGALKVCQIVLGPLARDCHFRRQLFARPQRHDPVLRRMDSRGERTGEIIATDLDETPSLLQAPGADFCLVSTLKKSAASLGSGWSSREVAMDGWEGRGAGRLVPQQIVPATSGLVKALTHRDQLAV